MARQIGDIIITGTIDDITFYKMEGKGYARKKTSLTGKRVKRDPRFRRTMQSACRFARGNQLASKVYRSLPREEQVYGLFQELKRIAILAIKEGKSEAEVLGLLHQRVEMVKGITKAGAVGEPPEVRSQTGAVQKTPRLFQLQGGRLKEALRQRVKGRRLVRHPRTGQRDQVQKE